MFTIPNPRKFKATTVLSHGLCSKTLNPYLFLFPSFSPNILYSHSLLLFLSPLSLSLPAFSFNALSSVAPGCRLYKYQYQAMVIFGISIGISQTRPDPRKYPHPFLQLQRYTRTEPVCETFWLSWEPITGGHTGMYRQEMKRKQARANGKACNKTASSAAGSWSFGELSLTLASAQSSLH